ncbi:MAG: response regulator transcription factor [Sphingobacteriaceae bacterium]|nr:MAG: response regulator transcription factor [Sphingobacteriaceae bacterium]
MVNKKILVCDDDADILEMLVMLLETYGYDVVGELKSPNVFKAIIKENPGLLIVDLWMPLMSGDEVIKQLRKFPETRSLPIIVTSACIDGLQTAQAAGASYFISKPFDIFNLLAKVEQYYAQAS